jgi:hypothetical protein
MGSTVTTANSEEKTWEAANEQVMVKCDVVLSCQMP